MEKRIRQLRTEECKMTFTVTMTGREPKVALIEKIKSLEVQLGKKDEYINQLLDEIENFERKLRDRDKEIYEIEKRSRNK